MVLRSMSHYGAVDFIITKNDEYEPTNRTEKPDRVWYGAVIYYKGMRFETKIDKGDRPDLLMADVVSAIRRVVMEHRDPSSTPKWENA